VNKLRAADHHREGGGYVRVSRFGAGEGRFGLVLGKVWSGSSRLVGLIGVRQSRSGHVVSLCVTSCGQVIRSAWFGELRRASLTIGLRRHGLAWLSGCRWWRL